MKDDIAHIDWRATVRNIGPDGSVLLGLDGHARWNSPGAAPVASVRAELEPDQARRLIAKLEQALLPDGSPCKNCGLPVERCREAAWDDCCGWIHSGVTQDSIGRECSGLHGCGPRAFPEGFDRFAPGSARILDDLIATPVKAGE